MYLRGHPRLRVAGEAPWRILVNQELPPHTHAEECDLVKVRRSIKKAGQRGQMLVSGVFEQKGCVRDNDPLTLELPSLLSHINFVSLLHSFS